MSHHEDGELAYSIVVYACPCECVHITFVRPDGSAISTVYLRPEQAMTHAEIVTEMVEAIDERARKKEEIRCH